MNEVTTEMPKFDVGENIKVKRYRYGRVAAVFQTWYKQFRYVVIFDDDSYDIYRETDLLKQGER